jgi:hypothetical protein
VDEILKRSWVFVLGASTSVPFFQSSPNRHFIFWLKRATLFIGVEKVLPFFFFICWSPVKRQSYELKNSRTQELKNSRTQELKNSRKLQIIAFTFAAWCSTAFGASGAFTALASNVATVNDGSVLIYLSAPGGPNFCGGAQGDFVIPATVSENTRSRMLAIALSAKALTQPLTIYYDGTCSNGRHVAYLLVI